MRILLKLLFFNLLSLNISSFYFDKQEFISAINKGALRTKEYILNFTDYFLNRIDPEVLDYINKTTLETTKDKKNINLEKLFQKLAKKDYRTLEKNAQLIFLNYANLYRYLKFDEEIIKELQLLPFPESKVSQYKENIRWINFWISEYQNKYDLETEQALKNKLYKDLINIVILYAQPSSEVI